MGDTRALTQLNYSQLEKLSTYPSVFNERLKDVLISKLKVMKIKLDQESRIDIDNVEEKIHKLNFMTWVEYRLRDFSEAKNRNDDVMLLTKNNNATALTGRALLAFEMGETDEVDKCLDSLDKLMSGDQAKLASARSRAQIAYCLCRVNTPDSLRRGIKIYKEVIEEYPDNYNWMLGLALAYRRSLQTCSPYKNIQSAKEAAHYFCCVINNSKDESLLRQAYPQVVCLKQVSDYHTLNLDRFNELFKKTEEELIQKALNLGSDDAKTCFVIGVHLRQRKKLDEAIEILTKSGKIKESSVTFGFLGKCFENKITDFVHIKSDNDFLLKAIENYKKSTELSQGINLVTIYNLGKLLNMCGRKEEALEQFLHIISRSQFAVNANYFYELSESYKYAALCTLELARDESKKKIDKFKAEDMFLQFANLVSELPNFRPQIIYDLLDQLKKEKYAVPEIFSWIQSNNIEFAVIETELNRLTASKKYESAFTLLSLMKNKIRSTIELKCLILKVKLLTMATRLQHNQSAVHFISRPLFALSHQMENRSRSGHSVQQTDIVIIYDTHQCNSEQLGEIMLLKDILTGTFGLDVYIIQNIMLMADVETTKLVLVLVHRLEPSSFFQQILNQLTSNCPKIASAHSKLSNIVIGQVDSPLVNPNLTQFPHIQLDNVLHRLGNNREGSATDHIAEVDDEFSQRVHDLMSIYCLLIGQAWP
ncbi:hypothetical protein Btru_040587 [Bulinus truncatus]|nr:hypothetical protein Btru_040587 [Bulinus truncatus]